MTCIFHAGVAMITDSYISDFLLWPREAVDWEPLCSHSPLKEAIRGGLELSEHLGRPEEGKDDPIYNFLITVKLNYSLFYRATRLANSPHLCECAHVSSPDHRVPDHIRESTSNLSRTRKHLT